MLRKQLRKAAVADAVETAKAVLGVVIPPESCPLDFIDVPEEGPLRQAYHKARRENRSWRWRVAGAILGLIGFGVWVLFASGYTRASEVDQKIAQAIKPIQEEVAQIKLLVQSAADTNATMTRAIIEQLATREADAICRTLARQKKETDPDERRRLRSEADEAQDRYRDYKKEYYPESRCDS